MRWVLNRWKTQRMLCKCRKCRSDKCRSVGSDTSDTSDTFRHLSDRHFRHFSIVIFWTGVLQSSLHNESSSYENTKRASRCFLALTSSITLYAIFYSHYSQVSEKEVMRAGVARDKERLRLNRKKKGVCWADERVGEKWDQHTYGLEEYFQLYIII